MFNVSLVGTDALPTTRTEGEKGTKSIPSSDAGANYMHIYPKVH